MPRLRPLPHPSCEVRPLWNRDFDDETVLRHRLGQPRVRRQTLHLEDHDPAAAAPGSVGELFERLAGHRHEAVGRPHDGRAGGAGEQRHRGRLIEDIAGIGSGFTGELPPGPRPVGLIGAEAVAKQAEHVAGEERLVADQRDQRRHAERPVGRPLEDIEGAGSVGHGTALHGGAVSVAGCQADDPPAYAGGFYARIKALSGSDGIPSRRPRCQARRAGLAPVGGGPPSENGRMPCFAFIQRMGSPSRIVPNPMQARSASERNPRYGMCPA